MWFVYIIKSTSKKYTYIGSTNNIGRRLSEHNQGLVKSTKPYTPFKLSAYIAVQTESKARQLEKYFIRRSSVKPNVVWPTLSAKIKLYFN